MLAVIPFEDEADAVRIANDVRYGLMATVWTGDPGEGHRLARRIKSGTFTINLPYGAFPGIPFGYKQSGFGREQALETLQMYLETKAVLLSTGARPRIPGASSHSLLALEDERGAGGEEHESPATRAGVTGIFSSRRGRTRR